MPVNLDRLKTGGAYDGPLAQNALPPAAPPRELAPGERVGPFRIERELSRGGMGVVYLAQRDDGEFAQRVALKWMAGARDREVAEALFRRERDIVASLEHPGIARLIDGGREADDMLWFAMEYVEGEPIDVWCEERLLSTARRVALVVELCDALSFAHQRLLIHRDIKPANVLVGADGRVKLLDFGIARLADQRDLLGGRALTPGYASPEQCAGDEVTVASDVYQVGLLLARLLGVIGPLTDGTHATRAGAEAAMGAEPIALGASRLAPLGRELAAIVARATVLHPAKRYTGVAALAEDLQRWHERRPVQARNGGMIYRLGCGVRRHPWSVASGLVAVALLAGLGWRLAIERNAALDESARARQSMQFLVDLLKWAKPTEHRGADITVDEALQRGIAQLESARGMQPRHAGELSLVLGSILLQRRERDRARPLLERAYALLRESGEDDTRLLTESALHLGSVLGEPEDRARSLGVLDEALRTAGRDPDLLGQVLSAYRVRAIRLSQQGDLSGALVAAEDGLRAARAAGSHEHDQLSLLATQAGLLSDAGDLQSAVEVRQRIFDATARVSGTDHPDTSAAAVSLANALIRAQRLDEAAPVIEADVALRLRHWGPNHPEYARGLNLRAFLAYRRGQFDSAHIDAERAVAIARSDSVDGRQQMSGFLELLALIQSRRARFDEAEYALRAAVDPQFSEASLNPDFGRRRLTLVSLLVERGKYADALQQLDIVDAEMKPLGARHARRAVALGLRAETLEALGDRAGALRAADAALVLLPERSAATGGVPSRAELEQLREKLARASNEGPDRASAAGGRTSRGSMNEPAKDR